MKRSYGGRKLLVSIGLLLFLPIVQGVTENVGVHEFSGLCGECHLNTPEKGKKLLYVKEESLLCLKCHSGVKGLTHPVGMKPTMTVPKEFLLNWKGEVTCFTCHVAHPRNSKTDQFLLRKKSSNEVFCRSCHTMIGKRLLLHLGGGETAHVQSRYSVENPLEYVDELSMKCIGCHDASLAKDSQINAIGRGNFSHNANIGLGHPIGVTYSDSGAFVSVEKLDKRIRLFNNKVGCGSCHSPYSKEHYQLVMSNVRSTLCFACHRK